MKLSHYLLKILNAYRLNIFALLLFGLFCAIVDTLLPYMLKLLIDQLANLKNNIKDVYQELKPYIFCLSLTWFFYLTNMRILDYIRLKTIPNLRLDIINDQFSYLNQHSYQYFQNHFAGSLANKIMNLQQGAVEIIRTLNICYTQGISLIIALATLTIIQPVFSGILFIWVIIYFGITLAFARPIKKLSLNFAEAASHLTGQLVDCICNIMNMRLFARNSYENKMIDMVTNNCIHKDRKMQKKILCMRIVGDISILIFFVSNFFSLLYFYSLGKVTMGDFIFVINLSSSIQFQLWALNAQLINFSENIGLCQQALSILNQPIQLKDKKNAKPLKIQNATIEFKDVTFHYNQGKSLFKNKNVIIPAGQKVGLIGYSGGGKSTFVNLILRLFELESGKILIDSQNIEYVNQDSLREQISFIPQDIYLFHRSVMDNIRYGKIEASDEEVMNAAKLSNADEFIKQLPEGYQTLVGERGVKLSGGQRQRIAIARAILKNAPILILDEATSSLDSETENYIQESLQYVMKNKTSIVIAHRLSTITQMDRILVLDNGRIIEDGSHSELLKKQGLYAKLWNMQINNHFKYDED